MSVSFVNRSYELELLDAPNIPTEDLYQNLKELHIINHYLGGYQVMLKGIKNLLKGIDKHQKVRILDIGSGGGDTLKVIHQKLGDKYNLDLVGVDLKSDCIQYSTTNCNGLPIQFIQSDYRNLIHDQDKFDIIVSSLFCHHLDDASLIELFSWMQNNAKIGGVVNDLHRHPLAYFSIKWITKILSNSYLVKNDAPLSVARSFKKNDFTKLLKKAKVSKYQLKWYWAFRWLLTFKNIGG
ncbi:methyltransferase domain-containing protein [Flammeovirga sp. MY04]|uniref:methyltransferase domain-containing protein n=1 Tax=Flammeovirga sp. MY04 TaxID=1191459 RepID=UPI0008060E8C|nr:methyltransferase domain-containing protein [Flammeovirga sp. MY04]ANQ52315.1 methyltransferase domain-containing protein [Flammeovirga sp. MY04]